MIRLGVASLKLLVSTGARSPLAVSQNMKRVAFTGKALHITTERPVYRWAKPFYLMIVLVMCLKFLYFLCSNSSAYARVLIVSIGITTAQVTIPVRPPASNIFGKLRFSFDPSPFSTPKTNS